jgi:hypothetical protein
MALAMFLLLLAIIFTGLSDAAARGYQAGSSLIAAMGDGSRAMGELHESLGSFIMVLAGIHVAAVLGHWLLARENLVRAMITGRKHLAEGVAMAERPLAGPFRLTAMALLVVLTAIGIFSRFDVATLMIRPAQPAGETGGLLPGTAVGMEEQEESEAED